MFDFRRFKAYNKEKNIFDIGRGLVDTLKRERGQNDTPLKKQNWEAWENKKCKEGTK